MSEEELTTLDMDMLIVDEFHHIGAPVWGQRIKTIVESHENTKILGMSASAGYNPDIVGIPFLGIKDARPLINKKNIYARVFIKNKKL